MDASTQPTKDKEFGRFLIWLPLSLVEKLEELRKEKKWDSPDKFRTRSHAVCAAIEEFIEHES